MKTGTNIIQERTNNIPIKTSLSTNMKSELDNSLSLKQNFFDPSKSSPPNEFILKLQKRINIYNYNNNNNNNYISLINVVSLDKE
jgi:hypothetical protein